ncbi:MAG: hydrolase [Lachnospiraceae bacterium]|nr:hydrolase [Lachnospiraceae bacterium]
MRFHTENTLLLVIDFQEKLMPAIARHEEILERSVMLIRGVRILDVPVMLTQQYTKGLGASLPEIYDAAGSRDYYEKRDFSCCGVEELMTALKESGRKQIIVIGAEAHVCVLQTCLDLIDAGYQVMLAVDCIGSRKEADKNVGIQRATMEGVLVTTAESVLFELTKSAAHPSFREISALVK